jgi:amino acid transporter/nucleotide-binding universal stress UspA family protein
LENDQKHIASNDQQSDLHKPHLSFARTLGLFDATMLGLGVMLGAGVFVLVGVAAEMAGPAAILVFALNAVVTMFTAYTYMELSSAIPEAGGGFSYISKAFPSWVSFIAGWMLWMAIIISCALFSIGFGGYLWELIHLYLPALYDYGNQVFNGSKEGPSILLAVAICGGFVALNIKGADVTGKAENWLTMGKLVTLVVFLVFGALSITMHPDIALQSLEPFFANGATSVLMAMGVTFIAFGGYDLIAAMAEEVRDPQKTIPRAIWLSFLISSIARVVIVALAITCLPIIDGEPGWKLISLYGKTGLIKASEYIMSPVWVFIVALGGLMATTGALNAALLAGSRVSYTMGRRKMLPSLFTILHAKNRTPWVAIAITGGLTATFCILFDIKTVGSAASVMFLLVYALANMSLLVLRGRSDYRPLYKVKFYPLMPLLGILTSIGLVIGQFAMPHTGVIDVAMTLGWILLGLASYFLYFRLRMDPLSVRVAIPDIEAWTEDLPKPKFRIVVPFHNPRTVSSLIRLAAQIARAQGGDAEVVGVCVAEVPVQIEVHAGMDIISEQEPIMHVAELAAQELGIRYRSELRLSHNVALAITQLAQAERADLLVLGWKGYETRTEAIFGSLIDEIIENAPCDLLLAKITHDFSPPFDRVLLTTAGQENDMLAAQLTAKLITDDAEVTICTVVKPDAAEEIHNRAETRMARTREALNSKGSVRVSSKKLTGRDISKAIIDEAWEARNEVIMVGARDEAYFRHVFVGQVPERLALMSDHPVMLYKRHSGPRTILSRLLGQRGS